MPTINRIYEDYYDRGLRALSPGRSWDQPYSCTGWAELGATYPILDDETVWLWSLFGMGIVPQTVILDHTMKVRYSHIGLFNEAEIIQVIEQLLEAMNTVSVEENSELPDQFTVYDIYPNPFNSTAVIHFFLNQDLEVNVSVFDILGNRKDQLFNGWLSNGKHVIQWNVENLSSGFYFVQIRTTTDVRVKKVMYVK